LTIADELVEHLSEKYRVEVEKRVYFSSDDESVLVGIPDVSVATGRSDKSTAGAVTLPLPVQPETVTVPMTSGHASDYRILVSQADRRPTADLYGFDLQQPIPPFPVPLMPGEESLILELQPLLNRVYEKGRYHLAIDYGQPAVPPLQDEDEEWVANLLQKLS
jgi:hypothetical protein